MGTKSALKQKEYDIKISEVDLKDKDFFSTELTRAQEKKRKDHLTRILEQNKFDNSTKLR